MKKMKTAGRNENMKRTSWALLFRMIMGLVLAGTLLAPVSGLAAGPYVAKAVTEETDWISPVYDLLEEEMELPLSADWKTNGWTVEGDGDSDSTKMLFSYPAEGSGAFLGSYQVEYKADAGSVGSGQAMEALERHLVPALNFIRMMRLTLEYRLAMSDEAVNEYFSDRYKYAVRVPVFYSGKDGNVRVDVLPFYFVPRDKEEKGAAGQNFPHGFRADGSAGAERLAAADAGAVEKRALLRGDGERRRTAGTVGDGVRIQRGSPDPGGALVCHEPGAERGRNLPADPGRIP